ncbi:MAG: UMP kinase [Patescibacteria group bacterium]|nr:UMP kinase [Patescibacteria group bacterium]
MKRVLLKLSGEALQGNSPFGIDADFVSQKCEEILAVQKETGVQIAIVIGGGNIFRGAFAPHMDRNRADAMGMLATTFNAAALKDAFLQHGADCEVYSAITVPGVIGQQFNSETVDRALNNGQICILAGGTGSPFFSTDSAAALRSLELQCDAVLKATKVDGIYDKDPEKHNDAIKFASITASEALEKKLKVMDMTAFALCRDGNIPIVVFDFFHPGNIQRVVSGENIGTTVHME